jgi:hypothetical protein
VQDQPPLSIVLPARGGFPEVEAVLETLHPQVEATGAEVVVVGSGADGDFPDWVRHVSTADPDPYRLRLRGLEETRGAIVAVGEDHAFPRPFWCEAVIRAHAEHPDVPAVAGALFNGTGERAVDRAYFRQFASPGSRRSSPSTLIALRHTRRSREALSGVRRPGEFEGALLPLLSTAGGIATDDRIELEHHQALGMPRSLLNVFRVGRASYGYGRGWLSWRERPRAVWKVLPTVALRQTREARQPRGGERVPRREVAMAAMLATATAIGCMVGILFGVGRSAERTA